MRPVLRFYFILALSILAASCFIFRQVPASNLSEITATKVASSFSKERPHTATISEPQVTEFSRWTQQFIEASPPERSALISEGIQIANERRTILAKLIRADPERALAAAIPMVVREKLPAEILSLTEERISGRGDIQLMGVTPAPGTTVAEPTFRVAEINGREFRAYPYGRRAKLDRLQNVSIHGIAIDGTLAVADSPVLVLEPGESANGRTVVETCPVSGISSPIEPSAPFNSAEPLAVDVGGEIQVLCQPEHVHQLTASLIGREHNAADSGPGSSGVVGRPTQAWTHGTKRVLVIRVDFSDLAGVPVIPFSGTQITEDYAVNLFNDANGIRDYFSANSYGKTLLSIAPTVSGDSPDVSNVLRMPATAASYATEGNNSQLHTDARNAASAAGFNLSNYARIGVVFSNLSGIPGSRITYGGLGNITGSNFWVNGYYDFRVVAHEVGHNYGLHHSNRWKVTDGNPVSPTGTSLEYGDEFCVMGDADFPEYHFSHWNKSVAQWIPDTAVTAVSTSGTYRVYRFDTQGANLSNPLALKIVRNGNQDYWIGHRRATSSTALDNGAYVLWGYNENQQGNLLDLNTPDSNASDSPLQVGQSFNDTAAGITLSTIARGGSGNDEWIDVQVAFQPRIQFSAFEFVANEQGGSAKLTLTRTNNGSGAVSVNVTTNQGTAAAPADFTMTSGTITWPNGDLSSKTITVPLVADANAEGAEKFTVTLSGVVGGVLAGETNATVTIVDPGARDPQFAQTFINSTLEKVLVLPDGKIITAGWFSSIQDSGFTVFTRGGIARFNDDGTFDPDFAVDGGISGGSSPRVHDVARQADGKIIIGGLFTHVNGIARSNIARLNEDGSLDTTFNPGSGASETVNTVLALPNGTIIVGGSFSTFDGQAKRMLARLNSNGSVDSGFTPPSFAGDTGWRVESLAAQSDGKLLVGGTFYFSGSATFKSGICRVTTAGALDPTFSGITNGAHESGNTGSLRSIENITILNDGSILIAGGFTGFNGSTREGIAKLSNSGVLNPAFVPTCNGSISALRLQPDGKILVGGSFSILNGATANNFARLTPLGTNDTAFIAAGGHGSEVKDFAFQPDGRVVFGGNIASFQGNTTSRPLWRFYAGLTDLPGIIQLSAETFAGIEGTTLDIAATRTGGTLGALTVGYSTVSGTAVSGTDFTAASGTLSWADGDASPKNLSIPITNDTLADSGESFLINLGEPLIGTTILGTKQQSSATLSTAFESWRKTHFSSAELGDSNISGDLADPDQDGRSNLVEFALGLLPKTQDPSGSPTPGITNVTGSDYLTLTFRRRVPPLDLTYTVQNNGQLEPVWTTTTTQFGPAINNGDGTETVTFRDNTPLSAAPKRFLRLQIQRAP